MKEKLNCVLLVDDNDSDNFIHKRVLDKAGIAHHVEIVMNGQEALDFLTSKKITGASADECCKPDLVLLDINMPLMDGWELLEELGKQEDFKKQNIVFIILTTSLNPSDRLKADRILGSDCFHFKPLTTNMITDIIQKHFPE
ncbi:MAG: response regulator [Bacteroidales bacterium]|nr:response regulator [Bacteroidales bacterium]